MWRTLKGWFRRAQKPAQWYEAELDGTPCWVTTIEHRCGHEETYSTAVAQDSEIAKRELRRLRRQACFKCRAATQKVVADGV